MLTNYKDFSNQERILYSPHKALDQSLDLGAIPERLFYIFYPIWRVQVEGRQRVQTNFEELEWFLERGLHDCQLSTFLELSQFFGLEESFVRQLVNFLEGIGHIRVVKDHLFLTDLGKTSVQEKVRYQDQETSTLLYFDGLSSRPLTQDHYKIKIFETLPEHTIFQALFFFNHVWDQVPLEQLLKHPDRAKYNLPDEISNLTPLSKEPAYIPIYIIQRRTDQSSQLPPYLVFSNVKGLRDLTLEETVNTEPYIRSALGHAVRSGLEMAVKSKLQNRGIPEDAWYLTASSLLGARVMLNGEMITESSNHQKKTGLTIQDIGRYFLVEDWCVWLTTDDLEKRKEASIEQLLEWLQQSTAAPTKEIIENKILQSSNRLEVEPVSIKTLVDLASQRGLARAMERLNSHL
jgi:hypothetical protein